MRRRRRLRGAVLRDRAPREGRAGGDARAVQDRFDGVVRGRRRLPHRRSRPRDRRGARRQPRARERAALPEPLHHVPVLPRRPGRWREFSIPTSTERRCTDDDRSARRRRRPRPDHGDRRPDDRHAARRPRRARHQDRAARRRPDPRVLGRAGLAPRQAQRGARPPRRRRPRPSARARDARRRARRELRPRHDREPRHRLRHAARGATRASSTARSPRTATTVGTPTAPATTRWSRRAPATSGRAAASPAARSPASPASRRRSRTSSCPTTAGSARHGRARCSPGVPVGERGRRATSPPSRSAPRSACASRPVAGSGSRRRCSRACSPPRSRRGSASSTSRPRTSRAGSAIPRAPKGVFRCADGRWIHQWVPLPDFVLSAAEGDRVQRTEKTTTPRDATTRIGMDVNEMLLLHHYQPLMAAARRQVPVGTVDRARRRGRRARCSRCARPRRRCTTPRSSPTAASSRSIDPELGAGAPGRAGSTSCTRARPTRPPRRRRVGADTDAVRAEADALAAGARRRRRRPTAPRPPSPLAGVRVLDLGLAVAGPWGTMMLADLGADVIKVNPLHDFYWMSTHIAMCCNRGKRSIAMNLKDPDAMAILRELVESADVVQHNMRYDAAVRLGVDYESLRAIKPDLIYCHTRGFEHGEREGAARQRPDRRRARRPRLARRRARPRRHPVLARRLAGRHRQRVPVGDRDRAGALPPRPHRRGPVRRHVDHVRAAAQRVDRVEPRRRQSPRRPPAARRDAARLARVLPPVRDRRRLAVRRRGRRRTQRAALGGGASASASIDRRHRVRRARTRVPRCAAAAALVRRARRRRRAVRGLDARLRPRPVRRPRDDREGVGHEVPPPDRRRHGRQFGLLFDLSETPGVVQGPPLVPGQDTRAILAELGYDDDRIDKLAATAAHRSCDRSAT